VILLLYTHLMPLISRAIFQFVHGAARKGLREDHDDSATQRKHIARRTGIRGETYAYWYLRRHGYIFVARNYPPRGINGELDLVGYDGETLAFVEVRTRTLREEFTALPELSVTTDKQRVLIRTAQRALSPSATSPTTPAASTSSQSTISPVTFAKSVSTKMPSALNCNRTLARKL
jgi:Holliday junction resolvase-like predicted endonuclease